MHISIKNIPFTEREFQVENVWINYISGPDNGIPLVLIPAQMGIWENYLRVLPALATRFHVYIVEIRGHGKSSWATGNYSWETVGGDLVAFLKNVVKTPAYISGNSSGGLIALWLAANVPDQVAGIILENPPLFSAEMPRFRDTDKFVYNGLKNFVDKLGKVNKRDLADYFNCHKKGVING